MDKRGYSEAVATAVAVAMVGAIWRNLMEAYRSSRHASKAAGWQPKLLVACTTLGLCIRRIEHASPAQLGPPCSLIPPSGTVSTIPA
jgi:hypothetical protein